MPDTIFSRILRGEIPCAKVYEDDAVFAFLDIGPLSPGHTLVIPKEPAATLDQLSDASAAASSVPYSWLPGTGRRISSNRPHERS